MILQFFTTVFVIYGIKASTDEGMILHPLYSRFIYYLSKVLPMHWVVKISKPLFDCTPCMASVYGTLGYVLYGSQVSIIGWLIWVFAIAGFNYMWNKSLNK